MDFTKLSFIFKGSSFINDSFIDDEKYKILAKLAGPLILHDEYLLTERLGNIKIAVALNLVPTSNNIPYQDDTQHLTDDITDKITGPNVGNSKDSRHPDTTPYQSCDNNKETTEIVPLNKKKRKSKNKELQPFNSTDETFVQQQYNDKEELDLEKHNGKVSSKIPTNYGKNRNQNTHASDMEDIIAIPALDFNNQPEILIDISTVQNNIDTPHQTSFHLRFYRKEEMDFKDQDASKAASSIQEFESAIKTKADNQKCMETDDKTDHIWYPPSKIKKPKKVLTDIKKYSTCNQTSMHTFIEEKVTTYNAYIPINDINFYDSDSNLKIKEKKYYTLHGQRISSREFKILEVPNNIDRTSIESSIRHLLHGSPFFITDKCFKYRSENTMTVYFTVKDEYARQLLKNVWSIDIENYIYRLGPAHFKANDFDERKKHRGEFIGFGKEHTVAKALEITAPFNPKSAFKQSLNKIIVEFQNEVDLFNACDKNYHFSDFNIKGYPLGYNWPQRDRAISKLKKLQFDKSNHTPDKSTQPQLIGSHETAANHDDDSKKKVNNKPHI
ncbi:unnamed protein product [Rhizophagus irregularis]|nr:unnamed protein product [Rhizophagus irregularis]